MDPAVELVKTFGVTRKRDRRVTETVVVIKSVGVRTHRYILPIMRHVWRDCASSVGTRTETSVQSLNYDLKDTYNL